MTKEDALFMEKLLYLHAVFANDSAGSTNINEFEAWLSLRFNK